MTEPIPVNNPAHEAGERTDGQPQDDSRPQDDRQPRDDRGERENHTDSGSSAPRSSAHSPGPNGSRQQPAAATHTPAPPPTPAWPPHALVLTAGVGSRLRPLTDVRAKPAVPVAGLPLVTRILRTLRAQGIADAVLNLHHRPETLAALIGDGTALGLHVRYSWEPILLGSAGSPRRALPLLESDPFLLVNGDTLHTVDYQAMWREHLDSGAQVTLALIPNPDPAWYNGVLVDDAGWVTGFAKAGTATRSFHIIGAQITAHEVFLRAPADQYAESTWGIYPALMAEDPHAIRAFICDSIFFDVGTTRDYIAAAEQVAAAEGSTPWTHGARFTAAPDAHLKRTIAWDDVTVGPGAELVDCILADGVTIPAGARYARCAIIRAGDRTPREGERLENGLLIAPISR